MSSRAAYALAQAEAAVDQNARTLWLVAVVDSLIGAPAVLVGGAAVNMYTGVYIPTDVDLIAYLSDDDRASLVAAGFKWGGTGHRAFVFEFNDGQVYVVEFPTGPLDGDIQKVRLESGFEVNVITLEDLVVDRLVQATDETLVTFEEAVRLVVATFEDVRWQRVRSEIEARAAELGNLEAVAERVLTAAEAGGSGD